MEKISGMLVLVSPELSGNWPLKGQIGFITAFEEKKQAVMVGFGTLEMYAYAPDALLLMKPKNDLYQLLLSKPAAMGVEDFKLLMRANILQESAKPKDLLQALEIMKGNPSARALGMESLADVLMREQLSVKPPPSLNHAR